MEKVYDYEDIKEICILDYYPSKLQASKAARKSTALIAIIFTP